MLAERHRARLAMQEGETTTRTETRRGHRIARRLFQDQDEDPVQSVDRNQDRDDNQDRNNYEESASTATLPYAGVEDNLTNRLSEEARENATKAEKRWNFDFLNERPLPGRWQWVKENENFRPCNENADTNTDQREKSETEANEKTN